MKTNPVKAKAGRFRSDAAQKTEQPLRKKRRLKAIAVLPSIITLMNGACGFIAIVFASRSAELKWTIFSFRNFDMTFLSLAGYIIFLAMVADVLDGRVARLTRTTSSFGGQLDSLSDAISFGAAPAFLMTKVFDSHLGYFSPEHLRFSIFISRGIFFSAIFYAMCAVVRLARFNVENEDDGSAHMYFAGLPTPAAAGIIVSLVIIHQAILPTMALDPEKYKTFEIITISAFPLITLLTGILMVSRIRYPHFANVILRGKKTLPVFLMLFACGIFLVWNIQLAMVAGFCGFALFGVFRWIVVSLIGKKKDL